MRFWSRTGWGLFWSLGRAVFRAGVRAWCFVCVGVMTMPGLRPVMAPSEAGQAYRDVLHFLRKCNTSRWAARTHDTPATHTATPPPLAAFSGQNAAERWLAKRPEKARQKMSARSLACIKEWGPIFVELSFRVNRGPFWIRLFALLRVMFLSRFFSGIAPGAILLRDSTCPFGHSISKTFHLFYIFA